MKEVYRAIEILEHEGYTVIPPRYNKQPRPEIDTVKLFGMETIAYCDELFHETPTIKQEEPHDVNNDEPILIGARVVGKCRDCGAEIKLRSNYAICTEGRSAFLLCNDCHKAWSEKIYGKYRCYEERNTSLS